MSFAKEVWDNLSKINVNEHVEKKGPMKLSYLSWAWAWQTLMAEYPASTFAFQEPITFPDGTVEVRVELTVRSGDAVLSRTCWLPAMDNKNNAIDQPNARQISDAKMRCLVKCIALFGLGMYLYAGEDLPDDGKDEPPGLSPSRMADWLAEINDADPQQLELLGKDIATTEMSPADKSKLRTAYSARLGFLRNLK